MDKKVEQVIKKFAESVVNVLGTMAMTEARPGAAFVKKDNRAGGDISGVIGFSSSTGRSKGTMSLTFTQEAALGVVNSMLGEEFSSINNDVEDAVGELTNMICGQARKGLSEIGMNYEGAIPSVITGKNHSIRHVSSSAILAIPFETASGPLIVEVCFS
ncbi:chemotaxis protein CheX [Desulfonatronovibrio hydrogenovorans]|uniref:chemotaxis protein CheX n=1 Tax=Desulfonatronovibrio hydrogenovorans TaxID=53245 RepID=UPI0004905BB7|nr:chemotaxis protein CheX [Desulfonatronovibrio hydrogenovorans]